MLSMVHSTRSPASTFTPHCGLPGSSATLGNAAPAPAVAGGGDPETTSQEMATIGPRTALVYVLRLVPESWPSRTRGAFPHLAKIWMVLSERFQMRISTAPCGTTSSDAVLPPPPLAQPDVRERPKMTRAVTTWDFFMSSRTGRGETASILALMMRGE